MKHVRPHVLSVSERGIVSFALSTLPALNRHVLQERLHHLAFVDGIPGDGTGLTSRISKTGLYDITLRASILRESLSNLLTTKERRAFTDDGSSSKVEVIATGSSSLTYVLLHESAHVVDKSCEITTEPGNPFVAGIWMGANQLAPQLASSLATTTLFRSGTPYPIGQGTGVYDALSVTPFVSLYSTASASEDFAELVAWSAIQRQHHGKLAIAIHNVHGKSLRQWEPLAFPEVKRRLSMVTDLLSSQAGCRSLLRNRQSR